MSLVFSNRPNKVLRSVRIAAASFAASALAAMVGSAGCSADNALVGGECASGYTQCGLVCVDTSNPADCGGCGNVCASGVCTDGRCADGSEAHRDAGSGGRSDGGADGSADGGAAGDSSGGKKRTGDAGGGSNGDGGAGKDGSSASDGQDLDGWSSDGSVGDGSSGGDALSSDGSADDGSLGDGSGLVCAPPDTDCGGVCVDEQTDPDNCGACGKFCPSGICIAGVCDGSTEGDIVVIGHDYHSPLSTLTSPRLLSNAVFLPTTNPVRVLSFEHYADPTSVANVKAVLASEATATGRKIAYTVSTTDTDIPAELSIASFDVVFIYDQESAAPGVLGPLGTSWAATLATFTGAGGVVVSLDGAAGTTQEMPEFDTSAGLLAVSAHTVIPSGTAMDVAAPGDAIGHGVFNPYAAEPNSIYFTTSEANAGLVTYVVVDPSVTGQPPVVVHKAVP
jgi:hypothetical protein